MNTARRVVIVLWLAGVCLQCLWVPWLFSLEVPYRVHKTSKGPYGWVFEPPQPLSSRLETTRIDVERLVVPLGAWTAACGVAFVLARRFRTKQPTAPHKPGRVRRVLSTGLFGTALIGGLAGIGLSLSCLPWVAALPNGTVQDCGYAWFWSRPKDIECGNLPNRLACRASNETDIQVLIKAIRAEHLVAASYGMKVERLRSLLDRNFVAPIPDWRTAALSAAASLFGSCILLLLSRLIRPRLFPTRKEI